MAFVCQWAVSSHFANASKPFAFVSLCGPGVPLKATPQAAFCRLYELGKYLIGTPSALETRVDFYVACMLMLAHSTEQANFEALVGLGCAR